MRTSTGAIWQLPRHPEVVKMRHAEDAHDLPASASACCHTCRLSAFGIKILGIKIRACRGRVTHNLNCNLRTMQPAAGKAPTSSSVRNLVAASLTAFSTSGGLSTSTVSSALCAYFQKSSYARLLVPASNSDTGKLLSARVWKCPT